MNTIAYHLKKILQHAPVLDSENHRNQLSYKNNNNNNNNNNNSRFYSNIIETIIYIKTGL